MSGGMGPFAAHVMMEIEMAECHGDSVCEEEFCYWGVHAAAWRARLTLAELISCCRRAQESANL